VQLLREINVGINFSVAWIVRGLLAYASTYWAGEDLLRFVEGNPDDMPGRPMLIRMHAYINVVQLHVECDRDPMLFEA